MKQPIKFGSSVIATIFAASMATAEAEQSQPNNAQPPEPIILHDGSRFYPLDITQNPIFDCGGRPAEIFMTVHGIGAVCDDDNPDDERPLPPSGGASPSM